ncbi:tRNA pseudouridine(38-40) synthase TruA [Nocardia zapadnayensis]|nr:tRNA pseudouridine(38-40) synthase TruA [Nocardia zapadnayensis]MCX0275854.1 tRNA pseudouridine(38-40) synthase TruA [Nocardia zapadnayensis]
MTRFRVELGYRGTGFHGWATQPGLRTVQGSLEAALATVCGEPVRTVVAGRTDAGVHARRQTVHLDLTDPALVRLRGRSDRPTGVALASRLRGALRHLACPDVVVHTAAEVPADFDARFAATWRAYTYRLADDRSFHDPLALDTTVAHRGTLDEAAMARAAAELLGLHDFLPFCRPRPDATTVRTLFALDLARDSDGVIVIGLRADAFCHHMVRALVGGLVKVGSGSWPETRPAELLARADAGQTDLGPMFVMPPHGLVLEEVGYPPAEEWAARAERTRARRT